MTLGAMPLQVLAQETPTQGVIAGKADDTAKKPYSDYTVQLRDPATGQIVKTTTLSDDGKFTFDGVELGKRFVVELLNNKISRVVCAEGPYTLASPKMPNRTDVDIDCGANPAAWWLLVAGAGAASAIGFTQRSVSNP